MSALIVQLGPVRNAVEQARRLGNPEPRESIVARIVRDHRAGHHARRTDRLDDISAIEEANRVSDRITRIAEHFGVKPHGGAA